jgi:hypothetical protein
VVAEEMSKRKETRLSQKRLRSERSTFCSHLRRSPTDLLFLVGLRRISLSMSRPRHSSGSAVIAENHENAEDNAREAGIFARFSAASGGSQANPFGEISGI